MDSITFEELDPHWDYGETITKKKIIDVLRKEGEKDYLIFKLVKNRFQGEIKTRVSKGRVQLVIRPIYRPLVSEELWQKMKKKLQPLYQRVLRWLLPSQGN